MFMIHVVKVYAKWLAEINYVGYHPGVNFWSDTLVLLTMNVIGLFEIIKAQKLKDFHKIL
jgi:hypothetical protein